jgi:hypothetical protein
MQHAMRNMQHATRNMQRATCNMQRAAEACGIPCDETGGRTDGARHPRQRGATPGLASHAAVRHVVSPVATSPVVRLWLRGCRRSTGCGPSVVLRAELHHDLGRLGLPRAGLAGYHDRLRALVSVQPEVALLRDVVRVRRQPAVFRGQPVLARVGIIVGRGMNVRWQGHAE